MPQIYVNLPVRDLEASKTFFSSLGFSFNPQFSNDEAACLIVDKNIFVMLLVEKRFKEFINGEIADTGKATEVLICLSADSREHVDDLVGKAIAAGGKHWKPKMEHGFMYGWSFQDLDGHVWELGHMPQQEPPQEGDSAHAHQA